MRTLKLSAWFLGGTVALSLAGLQLLAGQEPVQTRTGVAAPDDEVREEDESPCPSGQLPDEGVCVPAPGRALSPPGPITAP